MLEMPVGGKLVLKGGHQVTASGVTKKKKKKSKGGEGDAEKDKTGKSKFLQQVHELLCSRVSSRQVHC